MMLGGIVAAVGAEENSLSAATALASTNLHHCFQVTPRLLSGSQPEGDAAFAELARRGVKIVLSVDGAKPDVESAHRHGLRYIHLPFGYDGVPAGRVAELVQAASLTNGPIYVHCHHGQHRGPAAAALMAEASEGWSPVQAEAFLKQAGTAPDYPGLYRSVREFRKPPTSEPDRVKTLPEINVTSTEVERMVALDAHLDRLKSSQRAAWRASSNQPESAPAHQATLLWEQLRELRRQTDPAARPAPYLEKLAGSEQAALELLTALKGASPISPDEALKALGQSCAACHKQFRN